MNADGDFSGMAILQKAGSVLDALETEGEASVARIAEIVDEPVSSTYRLLSSLTGLGWVDQGSQRGKYRLGLEVVRIGELLEDRLDVRRICEPILRELRDRTRDTTFLCYRRGTSAVCVERISGHEVQSLAMHVGDSFELYSGAAPLAILAFLPPSDREYILDQFESRRTLGERIPDRASLEERIASVRAQGIAISDEDITPGIGAVGAPIFDHRGELAGSLSVSGLKHRVFHRREETAGLVRGAAARASTALGFDSATDSGVSQTR